MKDLSGLYIHVPFCQSKCHYCDFYSVVSPSRKHAFVQALLHEIKSEASFLGDVKPSLRTIYFGGGTPSMLSEIDFNKIFEVIHQCFDLSSCDEVSLEANPDDLSSDYIDALVRLPFNRISIGVQSFIDTELATINRRHSALTAVEVVEQCAAKGFSNISIDLMYGLPNQTLQSFEYSLNQALKLPIQHLSSYALSWEEGSVLYHKLQKGELVESSDEMLESAFFLMKDMLMMGGLYHYELSNFARQGFKSRHNSLYWDGTSYLGLGPGAHSYNGIVRRYTKPSLKHYLEATDDFKSIQVVEALSDETRYNDYIITRLRNLDGLNLKELEGQFGQAKRAYCLKNAEKSLQNGTLEKVGEVVRLTRKGLFISDTVMADLLMV